MQLNFLQTVVSLLFVIHVEDLNHAMLDEGIRRILRDEVEAYLD